MQQVRISTAQVLLASCMRATLFWEPGRWSGLHSRSMPITLSVMLSRRAANASANTTEPVNPLQSRLQSSAAWACYKGTICAKGMMPRRGCLRPEMRG